MGLAYSKMNRHSEAIDAYRNALRIEPDNQDYKNNMEVTQQRLDGNSNQNLHLYFKLTLNNFLFLQNKQRLDLLI